MPTYIDLDSLSIDHDVAVKRARLLGLSGKLLPTSERTWLLNAVQQGDAVICSPQLLLFWRILPESVALVSIEELSAQDPLPLRYASRLVWALVINGVPHAEAVRLADRPPKSSRHRRWLAYRLSFAQAAIAFAQAPPTPELEELTSGYSFVERPYTYKIVDNEDVLADFVAKLRGCATIGVDVETDLAGEAPHEMRDRLVGVGVALGNECFFGYASYEPWMVALRDHVAAKPFVGWNAKYDISALRRYGVRLDHLVGDGTLAAYLVGEPNARLKDVVQRRLGYRMITYDELTGAGKSRIPISQVDKDRVASYCSADAYFAVQAEKLLRVELPDKARALYHNVDLPLVTVLCDMQERGALFDRDTAAASLRTLVDWQEMTAGVVDDLTRRDGREGPPINLGSPRQLADFYHRQLGLPVQRASKQTGKPSVDALALLRMQHTHVTIPLVLQYKRFEKQRQFLVQWLEASGADSRLHCSYSNVRVRSHRFSSIGPNLQQVKLDWRKYFIADPGQSLVAGDYSQIEVRIAAYASHDPAMLRVIQSGDIHDQNGRMLFGAAYNDDNRALRVRSKNFLFGALYGSKGEEVQAVIEKQMLEDPSLAALGVPNVNEIRQGINNIRDIYGRYFHEWGPFEIEKAKESKNTVYTLFGRPRVLPGLTSRDRLEREAAEREAINHIVQGSAADVIRLAMLRVDKLPFGRLLLTVHDELVATSGAPYQYAQEMKEAMELDQPFEDVPLVVDIRTGQDWFSCHR